jgi:hypothetical protein
LKRGLLALEGLVRSLVADPEPMVLTSIQRRGSRCTLSQQPAIEKKKDHLRIQCRQALVVSVGEMPYLSAFHRAISASTAFWAAPERLARVSIEHGVRSETVGSRHHHPHSRGAEISSPEQKLAATPPARSGTTTLRAIGRAVPRTTSFNATDHPRYRRSEHKQTRSESKLRQEMREREPALTLGDRESIHGKFRH